DKDTPLTQNFIRQLHKTLLREDYTVYRNLPGGIQTSYVIHAGQYKTRPNSVITRYGDRFEYASPEETPALMTSLVDWYNEAEKSGKYTPVELAALFHYRYIRIHPFEDGNGRIARLMVNYILARHDWPMIVVRARDKYDYLEALHQTDMAVGDTPSEGANATLNQIKPFLNCFSKIVETEMQYNIDVLSDFSKDSWCYDGKIIKFRSKNSSAILTLLKEDPSITIDTIAKSLCVVPLAVKKQLRQMIIKGYIQRREKDGSWHVFASQSV
ncbi:MAG: Fic family protein, partial [Muribaculaceae bacterium]|nr:Fic family protein [Muribaculaceae bacterium]